MTRLKQFALGPVFDGSSWIYTLPKMPMPYKVVAINFYFIAQDALERVAFIKIRYGGLIDTFENRALMTGVTNRVVSSQNLPAGTLLEVSGNATCSIPIPIDYIFDSTQQITFGVYQAQAVDAVYEGSIIIECEDYDETEPADHG